MRSKRAIYNIITSFILQIVVVIYGFVVPKIIIDHFGSNVNGLVTSITQFLAYITLLESGFGPVVKAVLYKPIAKKDKKMICNILKVSEKFFRKIAAVLVVYIIILCMVFPIITSSNFDALYTVSLIIIIGISTFAEYYFGMAYRLFLQAKQKTYIISIIQIITYVLCIGLVVVLANNGVSIQTIKLTSGFIFLLRPLLQNYYVKKKYDINYKTADDSYAIKQKWDGLAQHVAAVVHENTDVIVLTLFSSLLEVSVYAVYRLITKGIRSLVQSFSNGIDASFGDMIAKNEHDNLDKKFSIYELLYFIVLSVIFPCAIVLITPFVVIYTKGVTDVNYFRPVFGYLIVFAELLWAIKQPYNLLVKSAGHFKETRKGAWVEAILNISLSIVLVINFGLIGVMIGTIISTFVRMIEFIIHANTVILKRSVWRSIGRIITTALSMTIAVVICNLTLALSPMSFKEWLLNAIVVFLISCTVTFIINYCIFSKEMNKILRKTRRIVFGKRIIQRRKKNG